MYARAGTYAFRKRMENAHKRSKSIRVERTIMYAVHDNNNMYGYARAVHIFTVYCCAKKGNAPIVRRTENI